MKSNFDFQDVGQRMPYTTPEKFFQRAKARAKGITHNRGRTCIHIIYKVAVAAAAVVAACGVALWFEDYLSPERQYERLLAQTSTEVLWEYACECDIDAESEIFY